MNVLTRAPIKAALLGAIAVFALVPVVASQGRALASGNAVATSPIIPVVVQGALPGNGVVPPSVVDVPSCVAFLTSNDGDQSIAMQACQGADELTQLFGGSLTFNKVFSCSYAQAPAVAAGGQVDRDALAACLGLPNS